jgi:cyclase
MRAKVTVLFALFVAGWLWLDAHAQSNANPIVSGAHRFEKVAEGIYYTTASGTMSVGANSPVVITDTEAIIVDSQITPAAARAMVQDIKVITDKPIRYVIDSHYHYDHAHGNQVFGPEVQVIGHENTRKRMLGNVLEQYTYLTSVDPSRVTTLKERIAETTDAQQKATLERNLANQLAYLEAMKEVKVTPPNMTLNTRMSIYRGGRELELVYLGRGHTDTDLVVLLPKERIVLTGDLMESVISYMGDSYPEEWIATLERLKALDFDTVMPGHGVVFKGKDHITAFQRYLRSYIDQTNKFKATGLTAEQAAPRVDLTAFSKDFPQIRAVGADIAGVRRIYKLAQDPEPAQ